jgi:hypothetical protein
MFDQPATAASRVPVCARVRDYVAGVRRMTTTTRRWGAVLSVFMMLAAWCEPNASAWSTSVNGRPSSDNDDAAAVAVDAQTGSVFVAGGRQNGAAGSAFVVLKFGADGQKQWQHILPGADDSTGEATALALDPQGFVFAAGVIATPGSPDSLVIVKLDARSARKRVLWTRTMPGFSAPPRVNGIHVTPDGGLAVVADTPTTGGSMNVSIMKFAADGSNAWSGTPILNGTAPSAFNITAAVNVLPNGDLAVAASLQNGITRYDATVARFDGTTGERRWALGVNDPSNNDDFAAAVAVAPNGDLLLAGSSWTRAGYRDFMVARITGDGRLLWRKTIDAGFFDAARTVAVAPNGNVIAGGTLETDSSPGTNSAFFVVALAGTDGGEQWRYQESGMASMLEARDIAIDRDGNAVVTGLGTSNTALSAFAILALSEDSGAVVWDTRVAGTVPLVNQGYAIVADPARNAVVAIGVTQNQRTSSDLAISHITGGHEDWRQVVTGRGKRRDRSDGALALAIDPRNGTPVLAGYTQNAGTGLLGTPHDFTIAKVRDDGALRWKSVLTDASPHLDDAALAVTISSKGVIFAAGRTCNALPTSCFSVARFGSGGREIWRTVIPGAGAGNEARAIGIDPRGGGIVAAGVVMADFGPAFAVVKFDAATGDIVWATPVDISRRGSAQALAFTSRGTVAVAGTIDGSFAVLELNTADGTMASMDVIPGSGEARSVAFDRRDGAIVAAGSLASQQFLTLPAVARFDATGKLLWSTTLDGVGPQFTSTTANAVAIDRDTGAIAVAGSVPQEFDSVFTVAELDANGTVQWRTTGTLGVANDVAFAGHMVMAVGTWSEDGNTAFATIALGPDGTEQWRRSFVGDGVSAAAIAVDDATGAVFAAGTMTNAATSTDMFIVGLTVNGEDLPIPEG